MSVKEMFDQLNLTYVAGADVNALQPGQFTRTASGHMVVRHVRTAELWALSARSLNIAGEIHQYDSETQAKLGFLREYAGSISMSLPIYW